MKPQEISKFLADFAVKKEEAVGSAPQRIVCSRNACMADCVAEDTTSMLALQEKKAASGFPFTVPINDANFAKAVDGSKRTVIILYTKGGKLVRCGGYEQRLRTISYQTVWFLTCVLCALTTAHGVRGRVRRRRRRPGRSRGGLQRSFGSQCGELRSLCEGRGKN